MALSMLRLFLLTALFALPIAARAQTPMTDFPVLDAASVPYLDDAGRVAYRAWLDLNEPRAIAIGRNGVVGAATAGSLAEARTKAMSDCQTGDGEACQIYAENLDVVWPGRGQFTAPPPGPLVETDNYAFVPDDHFIWRGDVTAAGVVIWAHGNGGPDNDERGQQAPPFLRPFNNAGYDILRFDRQPMADSVLRAAGWLRTMIHALRERGYHRIVVAGQSRGGWTALQMLDDPGTADAVIAIAPAAHGSGGSPNLLGQYDDLRKIVTSIPAGISRLAFVQFAGDLFSVDPGLRADLIRQAAPRLGALIVIDRPIGLIGHFAGDSAAFARRYGDCLLRFVASQKPIDTCEERREPPPANAGMPVVPGEPKAATDKPTTPKPVKVKAAPSKPAAITPPSKPAPPSGSALPDDHW